MSDVDPMDAVRAMRDHDVDEPERFLRDNSPEAICAWCDWFGRKLAAGEKIGTGLLISKIRTGNAPEEQSPNSGLSPKARKRAQLLADFAEKCERFPVGSVVAKCVCGGDQVVIDVDGGAIAVRCGACVVEEAYPPKAARSLPSWPLATGREVPARGEACSVEGWACLADRSPTEPRREDRGRGPRQLDFAKAIKLEPQPAPADAERIAA